MVSIFGVTNQLNVALQKKEQDIVNAMKLVDVTKASLQLMRDNGWDSLIEKVNVFCSKHGVMIPSMDVMYVIPGRHSRGKPQVTNLHHFQKDVLISLIDYILQEFDSRFDENFATPKKKSWIRPCHIPWEVRLRIAKGVARGLCYIHEKKHVHGNLKPSNILLDMDMDMEPKICDFGLDKLITGKSGYTPGGPTHHFGSKRSTTSRDSFQDFSVGATPSPSTSSIGCVSPYHPPESLRSLKPSSKSDVYSFGVVLLELLIGKVIISDELGPPVLAGMAVGLDDKTRVLRMVDPAIRVDLEGKEGDLLICLKLSFIPKKRPTMKEVVQVLDKISASPTSSYHDGL